MRIVCIVLQGYIVVIFARIVLEWIPVGEGHPVARVRGVLRAVTQPVLAPVRALVPPLRVGSVAVDLSPLIVIVLLQVLAGVLC